MNKFTAVFVVGALTFCTTVSANPCMTIAEVCMKQGYHKGGNTVGKGLVEDCVKPVVMKKKILPNTTFSDDDLTKCASMLKRKMP